MQYKHLCLLLRVLGCKYQPDMLFLSWGSDNNILPDNHRFLRLHNTSLSHKSNIRFFLSPLLRQYKFRSDKQLLPLYLPNNNILSDKLSVQPMLLDNRNLPDKVNKPYYLFALLNCYICLHHKPLLLSKNNNDLLGRLFGQRKLSDNNYQIRILSKNFYRLPPHSDYTFLPDKLFELFLYNNILRDT